MTALIVCSHGTADPNGQRAIDAVIEEVRALLPGVTVSAAVVDVEEHLLDGVMATHDPAEPVVVVPLLLSVGFHTAVDIARAVRSHPGAVQTRPLGTHPLIADVLVDRLTDAVPAGLGAGDHIVLAAAGSSNPLAEDDVRQVAERLQYLTGAQVTVGYASAATPRVKDAVAAARAFGADRVIVASHVLAPGFFARVVAGAGADIVTAPLAPDARVARVVVERWRTAAI